MNNEEAVGSETDGFSYGVFFEQERFGSEICYLAQLAITSSVLPYGNPLDVLLAKLDGCLQHCSPRGKALGKR